MKSPEKKLALAVTTLAIVIYVIFAAFNTHKSSPVINAKTVHENVITTYFWAGEPGDKDNAGISNVASAWDDNWQQHYGGVDSPNNRNGYLPAAFMPSENPFYVALPYNDIDNRGNHKASSANCQKYQPQYDSRYSACKNIWIQVQNGSATAYAQWEDVGPFGEDDADYVFGSSAPNNTQGVRAGLDVSPAVKDYLHLSDVDHTSWRFVSAHDVPNGPWKDIITISHGDAL